MIFPMSAGRSRGFTGQRLLKKTGRPAPITVTDEAELVIVETPRRSPEVIAPLRRIRPTGQRARRPRPRPVVNTFVEATPVSDTRQPFVRQETEEVLDEVLTVNQEPEPFAPTRPVVATLPPRKFKVVLITGKSFTGNYW
jgi:hypothetical protein